MRSDVEPPVFIDGPGRWLRALFLAALAGAMLLVVACDASESARDGDPTDDAGPTNDAGPTEDGGTDSQGGDTSGPKVPELRSFTEAEAVALAGTARRMTVLPKGRAASGVGWAAVNVSCEDRAVALSYGVAVLARGRTEPPILDEATLSQTDVLELAGDAADVLATINVAGPLVTAQTLVLPDGSDAPGDPDTYYWPYHHAVVLKVDGALRVLDLSTGDTPLPIDQWLGGFVQPSTECPLLGDEEFDDVFSYWLAAFSNFVPGEKPQHDCGYTLTPIFTFRWDQEPQVDFVIHSAQALAVQLGALDTFLGQHGVDVPAEDLPFVVSHYAPLTTAEVCALTDMRFCHATRGD